MFFDCKYIDHNGKQKQHVIEASSKKEVYKIINSKKATPITIERKREKSNSKQIQKKVSKPAFLEKKKLTNKEVVFLFYNLGIMIESGVSVDKAIEISIKQMKGETAKKILRKIVDDVKRGMNLSEAIKKSKAFPPLVTSVIMSGEEAGNLERSFSYLSTYYESQNRTKSKVVSALIYPIIVFVVIIIAIYIISTTVLPKILTMDGGDDVGFATNVLIAASKFFEATGIWSLVIIIGVPTLIGFALMKMDKMIVDRIVLKVPVVKDLVKQNASIQFTTTLYILLSSGITINKSLEICRDVVSNSYIKDEIDKVRKGIMKGETISQNMNEDIFGDVVCHIISVGEESGNLVEPLFKSTAFLNEKMENSTKRLTELVAPITMLLVACIVGLVVIGTMTPMLSMYQ